MTSATARLGTLLVWLAFLSLPGSRADDRQPDASPDAPREVVTMAEFSQQSPDADAAFAHALSAVANRLAAARKDGRPITVALNLEKGVTYRIKRPINITSLDSFTLDGDGAEIINTTFESTFHLRSCRHVTLRNLSVDNDPLPFTQGMIAGFDSTAKIVTVRVDRGYPDDAKFLATIHDNFFGVMDRRTKSLKPGARNFISPNSVERVGDGLIKVHLDWSANECGPGQLPIAIGDTITLRASYSPAVALEDCSDTTFVGFTLYCSPGMGILENGGHGGTILRRVAIVPGPKPADATAERLVSTNSDGSHFAVVERGPLLEDCSFANTSDDAINVHGFYFFVVGRIGPRRYYLSPKWDIGLVAGDEIDACQHGTFRSLGQTRLVQLTKKHAPELKAKIAQLWKDKSPTSFPDLVYEIELERDLPLEMGDALTSLSRIGAGTTIRRCTFHACNRVLIKSPDSLIEDNQFSYSNDVALQAGSDIGFWAESHFANHLTIRNNAFTHSNVGANNFFPSSYALGAIYVGLAPPQDASGFQKDFQNRQVTIENNTIDDSYLYAIFVSNADGLKIVGNTIGRTFIRGKAFATGELYGITPNSGIFVGMTRNAEIENNRVRRGAVAKTAVTIDRSCPRNTVIVRSNALN